MEPMAPSGSEEAGNTKQPPKRLNSAKNWCFTYFYQEESDISELKKILGSSGSIKKWIYGEEVCPSTGKLHLQGYLVFEPKNRPSILKADKRIHWEVARGSEQENIAYCSKEGKVTKSSNIKVDKPLKILSLEQLYDWQLEIISIIEQEPDDRTIYWFWEPKGCVGKTCFSKYLSVKYDAVPLSGKKNDILYCAAEFKSDIYIYDIERSQEEFVSYASIEKIKDGYYMCAKYESKPIVRNNPHVIVFANFHPDVTKLSSDRWSIVQLNESK